MNVCVGESTSSSKSGQIIPPSNAVVPSKVSPANRAPVVCELYGRGRLTGTPSLDAREEDLPILSPLYCFVTPALVRQLSVFELLRRLRRDGSDQIPLGRASVGDVDTDVLYVDAAASAVERDVVTVLQVFSVRMGLTHLL